MMDYEEFIESKRITAEESGIRVERSELNPMLFDFQKDIVTWALRKGRAAIFADCGLGKTAMELEFANHIPGRTLIVTPLAVGLQTEREGEKFGIECRYLREDDSSVKIAITNYEILDHFNPESFACVILDESSILKSYSGKIRKQIIADWTLPYYRLAATATPAPNDYVELGNHSEFMGNLSRARMFSTFFDNNRTNVKEWRLKGHAEKEFWKWICSWAIMVKKPSDLGYDQKGFDLPPLSIRQEVVEVDGRNPEYLFPMAAQTLQERISERSWTVDARADRATGIIGKTDRPVIVWCGLNREADAICSRLNGEAVEIRGSDPPEVKEERLAAFSRGEIPVLVTKPTIAGFGLNWQHCSNVVYLGLNDSYEQFYQSLRRCWRFGQRKEVTAWIVTAETEGEVLKNVMRKEEDAINMGKEMISNTKDILAEGNGRSSSKLAGGDEGETVEGRGYTIRRGDCVRLAKDLEKDSVGYSIFSPPFTGVYIYSDRDEDMGNCHDDDQFFRHFSFLMAELFRVTMPGRCCSIHCSDLPASRNTFGYIGIRDISGEVIRSMREAGWIYHSRVTIWKDPVVSMQRTKSMGLLHRQLCKDSTYSRQGLPDYLLTFRKPGENQNPVAGELDHYAGEDPPFRPSRPSIERWQKYASPVWMDIRQSNTLQKESARDEKDERHICPLQFDVIERGLQLWSNEGDLVLSPFAGIGSEGFMAVKMNRRFIGFELKESYFEQMAGNLKRAAEESIGELKFA